MEITRTSNKTHVGISVQKKGLQITEQPDGIICIKVLLAVLWNARNNVFITNPQVNVPCIKPCLIKAVSCNITIYMNHMPSHISLIVWHSE